ncbi:MAG: carboxymuconolactone decarboxylase family protein [Thermoguttaceae bacterium]
MDCRTKELIAVGASVTANCQPCLEYHVGKAREHGASDKEIIEAVGIGKVVRKGAAGKMDQHIATLSGGAPCSEDASDQGCNLGD